LQKQAANLGMFLLIFAVSSLGISCRKSVTTTNQASMRPSSEAISEADRLYGGRADLTKVRQAIVALRQAQADDSTNYNIAWRLAEFNYFLGAHNSDSGEKDKAFREGIEAGKLAVKLQDGKPEGHFWLGANYGGVAEISMLAGLSDVEDIKREMETVIKLDEKYQDASAYMVLGQVYLESPTLLGGDTQKAISYLEKGLRLGPDNELMRFHLAEAYAQAHRNEDARKQIDTLLAMKPVPGFETEDNEAVAGARKLQEKLK
jgi:tetratricopeptide (TPR) repeat protein